MKMTVKKTKKWLNENGVPPQELKSHGGLVPDRTTKYGDWMYRNDPIAFYQARGDLF